MINRLYDIVRYKDNDIIMINYYSLYMYSNTITDYLRNKRNDLSKDKYPKKRKNFAIVDKNNIIMLIDLIYRDGMISTPTKDKLLLFIDKLYKSIACRNYVIYSLFFFLLSHSIDSYAKKHGIKRKVSK